MKYYVYRFSFYADGFKKVKCLADSRSVTGCYLLPMGISLPRRSRATSSRILTLTPSGHDVNDFMDPIVEDIIRGVTNGIPGVDPEGKNVIIFLDPSVSLRITQQSRLCPML